MEKLMQYVWQHRLCLHPGMKTVDGMHVQIIDPGQLNTDAGPDFFKATVVIDNQMWVGDVEIHVRASDWHRHNHDTDPAYNTVVLHVVEKDDCRIRRQNGEVIPQMVMECVPHFSRLYNDMVNNTRNRLACAAEIADTPSIYITDWISNLGYERLHNKADRVTDLVNRFHGSWYDAIYLTLARALGFGKNNDAFERMAMATPLNILLKHSDNLTTVEALLLGQAGFLPEDMPSPNGYFTALREEYKFMAHKFGLKPPGEGSAGWKMARMRPQNFPHRRIATLAAMVANRFKMAGNVLHVSNLEEARKLFDVTLSDYWLNCYNFMPASTHDYVEPPGENRALESPKALSAASVDILIINVVVPILYAYAMSTDNRADEESAVEMLLELKPENNSIVRIFTDAGIECRDAFTSQALIELHNNYCVTRKCLYCRVGHRMLAAKAVRH